MVVVDPPRAGLTQKMIERMSGLQAGKIIYVSCDPATLARDIKLLTAHSYQFTEATPVDMFPHTSHIENVALLHLVKEKSDDVTTQ